MGQFDQSELGSPASAGRTDAQALALNGAAVLFEQQKTMAAGNHQGDTAPLVKAQSNLFPLLQNPQVGDRRSLPAGEVGNPDRVGQSGTAQNYPTIRVPRPTNELPRMQYVAPTPIQPSLLESTNIKRTNLDEPYVSETNKRANTLFESFARIGASAYFVREDHFKRLAAVETHIASTKPYTAATMQNFELAREGLLNSLRGPIKHAEVAMEALPKHYPAEIFSTSAIPRVDGPGKIMIPNHWEFTKLTPVDRMAAERYLNLVSLREQLTNNWPPHASSTLKNLPTNLQKASFIHSENLVGAATKFDTAATAFTDEIAKTLKASEALRIAHHNHVFKSAGTLAGAWVANTAVDSIIDTKHGPSLVTWTADLASPAILFTKYGMGTKFAVVTGAHILAKLYDKYNEK